MLLAKSVLGSNLAGNATTTPSHTNALSTRRPNEAIMLPSYEILCIIMLLRGYVNLGNFQKRFTLKIVQYFRFYKEHTMKNMILELRSCCKFEGPWVAHIMRHAGLMSVLLIKADDDNNSKRRSKIDL